MKTDRIAILGCGNIGAGVDELARQSACGLIQRGISPVEAAYLVDIRPMEDPRWRASLDDALADPEVKCVVETIGGCGAALALTKKALSAGRHVVTSNKELVAEHGHELQALAMENNVQYRFEAAVGGGIPLIASMLESLQFNRFTRIMGILNGTTNYILTRMLEDGLPFEDCLKSAQELGYAEPEPSADVSGRDTANKISILASMAFGQHFTPKLMWVEGVEKVSLGQLYEAHAAGFAIKLLGFAEISGVSSIQGNSPATVNIFVSPCRVPLSHPLSNVRGVNNAVSLWGDATGEVMLYGRGAGPMPTASAVLADVAACLSPAPRAFWKGQEVRIVSQPVAELGM
ncbi:MAG: homoserine dehydrogenase [Clostridia bacterium]|nr:homoserine dehydrogenase [Clostridia bacterium]